GALACSADSGQEATTYALTLLGEEGLEQFLPLVERRALELDRVVPERHHDLARILPALDPIPQYGDQRRHHATRAQQGNGDRHGPVVFGQRRLCDNILSRKVLLSQLPPQ